jgi:hypothetical protein
MGTFTAFFDLSFGLGNLALGEVAHLAGYNMVFLTAMGVASIGLVQMLFVPPRVRQPAGRRTEATIVAVEPPGE